MSGVGMRWWGRGCGESGSGVGGGGGMEVVWLGLQGVGSRSQGEEVEGYSK